MIRSGILALTTMEETNEFLWKI